MRSPGVRQIKIVSVLSHSGRYEFEGAMIRGAYEQLVDEINENGGLQLASLNGERVNVSISEILDDHSDKEESRKLMQELMEAHLDDLDYVFLAGYGSSLVEVQAQVANALQVPLIDGSGGTSTVYIGRPWMFTSLASIYTLAQTTMLFLKEQIDAQVFPEQSGIVLLWEEADHGLEA